MMKSAKTKSPAFFVSSVKRRGTRELVIAEAAIENATVPLQYSAAAQTKEDEAN
jgi:hypothetical protein